MADTVRCETSFTTNGQMYAQGREFDADDPIVLRYPAMFETPAVRTAATVPGEVTSPPAPVKKATAKKATKRATKRSDD